MRRRARPDAVPSIALLAMICVFGGSSALRELHRGAPAAHADPAARAAGQPARDPRRVLHRAQRHGRLPAQGAVSSSISRPRCSAPTARTCALRRSSRALADAAAPAGHRVRGHRVLVVVAHPGVHPGSGGDLGAAEPGRGPGPGDRLPGLAGHGRAAARGGHDARSARPSARAPATSSTSSATGSPSRGATRVVRTTAARAPTERTTTATGASMRAIRTARTSTTTRCTRTTCTGSVTRPRRSRTMSMWT